MSKLQDIKVGDQVYFVQYGIYGFLTVKELKKLYFICTDGTEINYNGGTRGTNYSSRQNWGALRYYPMEDEVVSIIKRQNLYRKATKAIEPIFDKFKNFKEADKKDIKELIKLLNEVIK